jgi:mRNA-degrading endonuclease RelE of RelBE toxin-antitoxin system/DNA-binding XRE family transcriptional regulator
MADIVFTPAALRQWLKLTPQARDRLDAKLNAFADTGQGDIKKLKGRDRFRLRVGDYRIIYYHEALTIIVVGVGHRRDIYESAADMKVQFKDTPKGEIAILPRAEYERLKAIEQEAMEDAASARLLDQGMRDVAAGAPLFPFAIVRRLADGENPIRVLRQFRGMTQAELAVAEGVQITQNYLSELETGKRKGPLALHRKLAQALDVPLDLLAPAAVTDREADPERLVRRKATVAEMKRSRGQR